MKKKSPDKVVQLHADSEPPQTREGSVLPIRVPRARRSSALVRSQEGPPPLPRANTDALRLISDAFAELGPMVPARPEVLAILRPELASRGRELIEEVDRGALRLIMIGYEPHFTPARPMARRREPLRKTERREAALAAGSEAIGEERTQEEQSNTTAAETPALDTDLELATMIDVEHERVLLYRVLLVVEALVAFALLRAFWLMS